MKLTKFFLSFLMLFTLINLGTFFLNAENNQDILPIGPSKFKFSIDKIEKDQIIQTAAGKTITIEDIIAQNKDTTVFVIGEAHDNYQCHTFQRDFIQALFKKYPKLIVGFEFFQRDDNPVLEDWRTGKISEEDVIKKTAWYKRGGQDYRFTRLIMDVIKENSIKTIGLNIPREILRTVSRKGFENLSKEEKALFPTIHIPNPEHEFFIKSIFGTF
ncbi:MAG: ChaN family lipoprotein, partial [Acidobacteria bacterium]|nr:ChaN family lipoprotein [Acidobacteriota bacterium]